MNDRPTPPTAYRIAEYWASAEGAKRWLVCIDLGEPSCMACGYYAKHWDKPKTPNQRWNDCKLDKAHIIALSAGGANEPSNYLMLCSRCHADAPMTNNEKAMFRWCDRRRSYVDVRLQSFKDAIEDADISIDDLMKLQSIEPDRLQELMHNKGKSLAAGTHFSEGMSHATMAAVLKSIIEELCAPTKQRSGAREQLALDLGAVRGGK